MAPPRCVLDGLLVLAAVSFQDSRGEKHAQLAVLFAAAAESSNSADSEAPRRGLGEEEKEEEKVAKARAEAAIDLITPVEVEQVQKAWGDGFAQLSARCREEPSDLASLESIASAFVRRLYAFGIEGQEVVVKPMQAGSKPFRRSVGGVVSSLIGGSDEFPEDLGLARGNWTDVRFENAGITIVGGQALAMGNSLFVDLEGNETLTLEFTIGFIRDFELNVRINIHFSTVPFVNGSNATQDSDITPEEVNEAIKNWGNSVVGIGKRYIRHWDYQGRLFRFLDTAFAFPPRFGPNGEPSERRKSGPPPVLFKPAGARKNHFRLSFESVQSYFVGGSKEYPEDKGFALRNWKHFRFETAGLMLHPRHAWAMGDYTFEDNGGWKVTGQFTIGLARPSKVSASLLWKDEDEVGEEESGRRLRITVLHNSYPHDGAELEHEASKSTPQITGEAVEEAQRRWGRMLSEVCTGYRTAAQLVDNTFAYSFRPTLYKPTEAFEQPFRTSREGAISYFTGNDDKFPEDWGFTSKKWRPARFENEAIILSQAQAIAMGYTFFELEGGLQRRAEFIASFVQDERKELKFNLLHSAFPNSSGVRGKESASLIGVEPISRRQIEEYQGLWGHAIVSVGEYWKNVSMARSLTKAFIDRLYGFSEGPVLIKTTEATPMTRFRLTRDGAISYFAGGDPAFPADRGFATRPWVKVAFKNHGLQFDGHYATAMGNCYFMDSQGVEVELEYTINYVRDVDGRLRINVHHLSLPYTAKVNSTWDGLADGAKRFGGAAGSVGSYMGEAAQSFNPAWILPMMFVGAALFSLVYFGHMWDGHAGNFMQNGGGVAMANVNFGYLGDESLGGSPPSNLQSPYDPYPQQDSYPQQSFGGYKGFYAYANSGSANYMHQGSGPVQQSRGALRSGYGRPPPTASSVYSQGYGGS